MKPSTKDAIGKRIGNLTITDVIVRPIKSKRSKTGFENASFYEAKCDCGVEVIKRMDRLTLMSGCARCSRIIKRSGNPDNVKINNYFYKIRLYRDYKDNARIRNIEFSLSESKFFKTIDEPCYYCNALPVKYNNIHLSKHPTDGDFLRNGIDRLDNNQGYTDENVVPCCKTCNYMKHTNSYEEFSNQIEKIYKNLIEKRSSTIP